jgi:hypothetical protein
LIIDKEIIMDLKEAANVYIRNSRAMHILFRSDFKDETMFDYILEAHGIDDVDFVDSITIQANLVCTEGE